MLNEVRIIGRVQHAIPAKAGPHSGISFTVWTGILTRVSVPRSMDKLKDMLQRRTLVYVEGELCMGGSIWARRVIILADAKPRHIGRAFQDGARPTEIAQASEFPIGEPAKVSGLPARPGPSVSTLCPIHGERCPGSPWCLGA